MPQLDSDMTVVLRPAFRPERWSAKTICSSQSPLRLTASDPPNDVPDDAAASPRAARGRGMWALADQGVVSLGNSFTNILLARALVVGQFGVFSILLEAMLFLNSLQAALVIYPLSVRGAVADREGLRRLSGACLLLTMLMVLPLGAGVALAGGLIGNATIAALSIAVLATWQCQETLRRAMMAHGGHRQTLPGDTISYLGQATLVLIMVLTGTLTVERALGAMALTSGAAVLVQSIQIGPRFDLFRRGNGAALKRTIHDFWALGRWVALGNLTMIVTTLSCSWTLAYFHGTDAVGRFQALANLLKLSNPLMICMAGLIVPAAARAFRNHGLLGARRVTLRYGMLAAAALLPYYLVLLVLPTTSLRLLYGETTAYLGLGSQLRAFVLWYAALFVAQLGGCFLNAIEQSRRSFLAQALQTASVVLVALPLTTVYGLDGLMLGGVIGNLVMAGCYVAMIRRLSESDQQVHARFVIREMQESARLAA